MLQQFKDYINAQSLFSSTQKGLLAVSGGIDSSVLCHLMHLSGFPFAIAHCNFHLRSDDSDRDERFVRQLADKYGVDIFVVQFDTTGYAHSNHLSIEEAARHLRYDFFEQVRCQNHFTYIATAHHRDDATETFFLNLLRGTGISGLHGILPCNGYIVRPLLPFGRDEIEQFALSQGLQHVDDSTNASTLYQRNRIRLKLMPLLREISPSVDYTMQQNIARITEAEQIYLQAIEDCRSSLVHIQDSIATISLSAIENLSPKRTLLFELLRPYGFTAAVVDDVISSLHHQSGILFLSPTHRMVKDRELLCIEPLQMESAIEEKYFIMQWDRIIETPINLCLTTISFNGTFTRLPSNQASFDADAVRWPLCLRHWHHGDKFIPFGMQGSRLVSDFFSDKKLSRIDKEHVWILCDSTNTILWLVGLRASNNCKISQKTSHVLTITLSSESAKLSVD